MDRHDFQMHEGDDRTLRITVLDDDDQPVDLTDATLRFAVMRAPGAVPLIEKTSDLEIVVSAPATGVVEVPIEALDTTDLAGALYYELEMEAVGGDVSTVLHGRFIVHASYVPGLLGSP